MKDVIDFGMRIELLAVYPLGVALFWWCGLVTARRGKREMTRFDVVASAIIWPILILVFACKEATRWLKTPIRPSMKETPGYWREQNRPDLAALCADIGELWTPTWKQLLPWNSWRAMRKRQQLDKLLADM